jgi:hypothetical protein
MQDKIYIPFKLFLPMKSIFISFLLVLYFHYSTAGDFFVSTKGNDQTGNGGAEKPWRTISFSLRKIPKDLASTLQISAGTYLEKEQLEIPASLSINGAGVDLTIIKAALSFCYHPADPEISPEKFLFSFVDGNGKGQKITNLTIDGSARQLHGGIYINKRNRVKIEQVRVRSVNFCGIWLLNTEESSIKNTSLVNCSWASTDWCSGALQVANLTKVEIDNVYINEDRGYGVKAMGATPNHLTKLKIHDSNISVNPIGIWNDGKAPNISIELWSANLTECEISNCLVDNHISLVNTSFVPSSNALSIRVHHNTIDLETRAKGEGYGLELSVNNAEIDHNIFKGGNYGIVNWDATVRKWNIHHNVFYGLKHFYPGDILRSQKSGLHDVNFYNNTVELLGTSTINLIGLYGGESEKIEIKNNLIINSNTGYNHYQNKLVHLENSTIADLVVSHNLLFNLSAENIPGIFKNNLSLDPKINKSGTRHTSYYKPKRGSPLIDAGIDVNLPFKGSAPDIGAHEF